MALFDLLSVHIILLYEYTPIYLSILLLIDDHLFLIWAAINNVSVVNIFVLIFNVHVYALLFGS